MLAAQVFLIFVFLQFGLDHTLTTGVIRCGFSLLLFKINSAVSLYHCTKGLEKKKKQFWTGLGKGPSFWHRPVQVQSFSLYLGLIEDWSFRIGLVQSGPNIFWELRPNTINCYIKVILIHTRDFNNITFLFCLKFASKWANLQNSTPLTLFVVKYV